MSAGELTRTKPTAWTGLMTLAVIATLVVGSAIGSVTTLAFSAAAADAPTISAPNTGAVCDETGFNYSRLLGNVRAAAQRGDIRAFVAFRNDLANLIRQTGLEGSTQLAFAINGDC